MLGVGSAQLLLAHGRQLREWHDLGVRERGMCT